MPNVGDLGPSFALSNQEDQMIILDRLTSRHSSVVVAFLPQAGAQAVRVRRPRFAICKQNLLPATSPSSASRPAGSPTWRSLPARTS